MTRIVTTHYRYKRPPRKRKAVALEVPAIVRAGTASAAPAEDRKPAIVTARRPRKRYADVPDMTPEEHQRRGDAADALWRELLRRASEES